MSGRSETTVSNRRKNNVDREKFDHTLAMRQQLEVHYPDRNFHDAFQLSEELRDHFEIKLLVVGHFSAGKSALLNALLQRPAFLKEAQQPQTALATELVYDTTEQAFAYRKDGSCESCRLARNIFQRSTAIWNTM